MEGNQVETELLSFWPGEMAQSRVNTALAEALSLVPSPSRGSQSPGTPASGD